MSHNDAGALTVRQYLLRLLEELWIEEAGFDGKRPFGNSGWQYEVYGSLHAAGLIEGTIDEWDELTVDIQSADALIGQAIWSLQ